MKIDEAKRSNRVLLTSKMIIPRLNLQLPKSEDLTEFIKSTDVLPKPKVKASQFQVHISHFLQNCKKGKPGEMDTLFFENDITTN